MVKIKIIPLQLWLVTVAVEMSVAQMLKLHLNFVKMSFVLVAGAGGYFSLP